MINEAKEKREQQLRKQRLKNKDLPDFKDDDFVPTVTKSEIGPPKVHPRNKLYKEVEDFIDNPEKLESYKRKHYKGTSDTGDIDKLIHRARMNRSKFYMISLMILLLFILLMSWYINIDQAAKNKLQKATEDSESFEQEIRLKISRARKHLITLKQRGAPKSK